MDSIEIVPFEAAFQKEVEAMFVDGLVSQGPTSLQKWFTTRKLEQDMGDIHKHYIDEDSKRRSPFGGLMFFIAVDRNNEKKLSCRLRRDDKEYIWQLFFSRGYV